MLVLKILGIIISIACILCALYFFNEHCNEKFDYRFFTTKSFAISASSLALILIGNWWRNQSSQSGGDILNGVVIMGIGAIISAVLIYLNFKRTNFFYGFGGTFLQLSAFAMLAYIGFYVFIIGFVISLIASIGTPVVKVID